MKGRSFKSLMIMGLIAGGAACDEPAEEPEHETMLIELCQAAARAECSINEACNELGTITEQECIDWDIMACCGQNGYSEWSTCMVAPTLLPIERGWSCQEDIVGLGCVMDANQASCLQLCDDLDLAGWHICNDLDDYLGW